MELGSPRATQQMQTLLRRSSMATASLGRLESAAGQNSPTSAHRSGIRGILAQMAMVALATGACANSAPLLPRPPLAATRTTSVQTVAQRVLCIPATAAASERVFSAFSHVWSDKRASLILGRMWVMAYIYFNKRVLERKPKTLSDADWEEYERWMRKTPQDQS